MSGSQHHSGAAGAQRPSQELVLAALDRAAHHRGGQARAAPIWAVLEHLAVARRGSGARQVRVVLDALRAAGLIAPSRPHGVEAWELTAAGRRRLRRARAGDALPALPEAPQHREWRNAMAAAGQEIERFERALREGLLAGALMLDRGREVHSDEWFELAEALRGSCRRLGSAVHCLYEWPEPHDDVADLDTRSDPGDEELEPAQRDRRRTLRAGRRNARLWRQTP